jgi:hypothetical protein
MALTIACESDAVLDLDEYIDWVGEHVDVRDEDSIAASADKLRQLGNNQELIVARINRELEDWSSFQADNTYTSQTVLLGGGTGFYVRANLWMPPAALPEDQEWLDRLFVYRVPHDHNFSFLTVGYFGSGYETTIWEYERTGLVGEAGENVALNFLERTRLQKGKVMMYRACRDVHSQEHPDECSISLNLIACPPEVLEVNQFMFDTDNSQIAASVEKPVAGHIFLCTLARHVGNGATASILDKLAHTHFSAKARLAALRSLAELEPEAARPDVWRSGLEDASELVRRAAREALGSRPS